MLNQLTKDQLDQLQQHLIVPLAVSDILYHDLAVEPDMQYGLHMALSEIDPDSALLAIALCAHDMAEKCLAQAPIAAALQTEADNIIQEYGLTWLRHYKNVPMPTEVFESILETVPEDLEALADLMDALSADIGEGYTTVTTMANLLSVQARAHMEIANYILAELQLERSGQQTTQGGDGGMMEGDFIDMDAKNGNNIILFPTDQRH